MKKTLALLLAVCMMVAMLAGCAGGDDADPTKPADPTDAVVDNTTDPTVAPAENAIKIGGVGPLTGGAAIYGNAAANGAKIAAEEINALGGLQLDLNYQDDAHDAEKSVNAYNTLKGWGMQVFLGSVTSTPASPPLRRPTTTTSST